MLIKNATEQGVKAIADMIQCEFYISDDKTMYHFFMKNYLIMVGIKQIAEDLDYFDLRCRIFLGEIGFAFNPLMALELAHNYAEVYGCVLLDNRSIITVTYDYRFLTSWSEEYIKNVIKYYFGGAITTPFPFREIILLSKKSYKDLIKRDGLNKLIGINNIVNYELINTEI